MCDQLEERKTADSSEDQLDEAARNLKVYQQRLLSDKNHQTKSRELSPYVCTRHYRPPEVILHEKTYDQMADIWSLGCILAELMKVSEPYSRPLVKQEDAKKKLTQLTHDRLLFPGDSCYPMSPY